MAEERKPLEITKLELLVFLGVVAFAVFILVGGQVKIIDPLAAGIAVIGITAAFLFANWLETKGIFAGHATNVFMVLVLGILMVFAGLIARGIIPLLLATGLLAFDIAFNSLIYLLLAMIVAVVLIAILKGRKAKASVVDTSDFEFMRKLN
jgi:hypothetical protein